MKNNFILHNMLQSTFVIIKIFYYFIKTFII